MNCVDLGSLVGSSALAETVFCVCEDGVPPLVFHDLRFLVQAGNRVCENVPVSPIVVGNDVAKLRVRKFTVLVSRHVLFPAAPCLEGELHL